MGRGVHCQKPRWAPPLFSHRQRPSLRNNTEQFGASVLLAASVARATALFFYQRRKTLYEPAPAQFICFLAHSREQCSVVLESIDAGEIAPAVVSHCTPQSPSPTVSSRKGPAPQELNETADSSRCSSLSSLLGRTSRMPPARGLTIPNNGQRTVGTSVTFTPRRTTL